MTLRNLASDYVRFKQALGVRFKTDAYHLDCLCQITGHEKCLPEVTAEEVQTFLGSVSERPGYWFRKLAVLKGLNRFAAAHGQTTLLPLPKENPQRTRTFVPYILSRYELALLFAAIPAVCEGGMVTPNTARLVFLLLYGAGLRVGEALHLSKSDVDVESGILKVRATKFYKTRLVPVGPALQRQLAHYADWRATAPFSVQVDSFFVDRRGAGLKDPQIREVFDALRKQCKIAKPDTGQVPRMHDLRHSFAVHRLITGYQRGEDVQSLLPKLATYLGHASIESTQVYLTMTPVLLEEAAKRFAAYAFPEVHHEG
jgi:integrase/recombinase XerD